MKMSPCLARLGNKSRVDDVTGLDPSATTWHVSTMKKMMIRSFKKMTNPIFRLGFRIWSKFFRGCPKPNSKASHSTGIWVGSGSSGIPVSILLSVLRTSLAQHSQFKPQRAAPFWTSSSGQSIIGGRLVGNYPSKSLSKTSLLLDSTQEQLTYQPLPLVRFGHIASRKTSDHVPKRRLLTCSVRLSVGSLYHLWTYDLWIYLFDFADTAATAAWISGHAITTVQGEEWN